MRIPTLNRCMDLLREAEARNPGPWVQHSINVAEAARLIGARLDSIEPDAAYRLGLVHDIGRREGVTGMRHVYDGYRFMLEAGFPTAARICLTHSFPVQDMHADSSRWDCSPAELDEIRAALAGFVYDDYDRLLQLCDSIAVPEGFCLIEKRLLDVFMRHRNYDEYTIPKWQAYFDIKRSFEDRIGCSIYTLLPGIVTTTFDGQLPPS